MAESQNGPRLKETGMIASLLADLMPKKNAEPTQPPPELQAPRSELTSFKAQDDESLDFISPAQTSAPPEAEERPALGPVALNGLGSLTFGEMLARCNWANAPQVAPAVSATTTAPTTTQPVASMTLGQFLTQVNWSNQEIATTAVAEEEPVTSQETVENIMSGFMWD